MEQNLKNLISKIPKEVSHVTDTLEKAGFEAYLVGGCVRDLITGREPKDWDVTTNAKPEQIVGLFEKTIYENNFGTVGVCVPCETTPQAQQNSAALPASGMKNGLLHSSSVSQSEIVDVSLRTGNKGRHGRNFAVPATSKEDVSRETLEYEIIEVTPYRIEAKYSDFRHPDEVKFSEKLEDDLKRRDFTVNAMAFGKGPASSLKDMKSGWHLVDLFDGLKDIEKKTIRAVGNPDDRFAEDALRMLRAVRFSCQLDFSVSYETTESILKNSDLLKKISEERIRDEFVKIITSANASSGVVMLQRFGLLKNVIPELEEGIGCEQSGEHIYDVWNHLLHALQHAVDKDWPLEIRLAALFHDIGKPRSRRNADFSLNIQNGAEQEEQNRDRVGARLRVKRRDFALPVKQKKYTFYGHEVIGARMVKKIMERLKFPKKEIELTEKLIRSHMFFSDTELITLSAVRRIITKVGKDNIWDLMKVRECDRVGMKKKEAPYRLRKYFAMIEEALRDPISVGQLKINGEFMIKNLGITPGPRMGWILHALLEEVLDAPEKNTVEHLSELAKSLNMLGDAELRTLGERGKEKKEELEEEEVAKLHEKHGVRSGKGPDRRAGA